MNRLSKFALAGASLVCIGAIANAQVPGVNSTLNSVFTLIYEPQTSKGSFTAAASIVPATSATDVFELVGSSTKVIRIRRVMINGVATTAVNAQMLVVKRTAADDGNAITVPITVHDTNGTFSGLTSATAVAERYAANPTEPAAATNTIILAERFVGLGNYTTVQPQNFELTWPNSSGPILRGTAQTLALNLQGVTITGGQLLVQVEWTEE